MGESFILFFKEAFKVEPGHFVLFLQMCVRVLALYFSSFLFIRLTKRVAGAKSPVTFIIYVMLGSLFAAVVVGQAPFFPTYGAIMFLAVLDVTVSLIAFYFPSYGKVLRGRRVFLIKDGEMQKKTMRRYFISERRLLTALRKRLHTDDISVVKSAILTIDGEINFVRRKK